MCVYIYIYIYICVYIYIYIYIYTYTYRKPKSRKADIVCSQSPEIEVLKLKYRNPRILYMRI